MNRREALYLTSCIFGGTLVGAQAFLAGCSPAEKEEKAELFRPFHTRMLDEIGEAILPATEDAPGAQAAAIGAFIVRIVTDCYQPEEQQVFLQGLEEIQARSKKSHGKAFLQLGPRLQHELLSQIDQEAVRQDADSEDLPHYFTLMKQLTVWGYFTSEVGATQALRFVAVPGRYEGCVGYEEGEKAWAL